MTTTKLITLPILLYLLLPLGVCAQKDGAATLNINLYPVQTIEVNTTGMSVDLDYRNREDYQTGVEATANDHLKIYSTGGFAIKVKSASSSLSSTLKNDSFIAAEDISITATKGTTNGMEKFTSAKVFLSPAETELISSSTGAANRTFNINYRAKGDDEYLNKFFNSQKPTVYTTQVVYIIEPH